MFRLLTDCIRNEDFGRRNLLPNAPCIALDSLDASACSKHKVQNLKRAELDALESGRVRTVGVLHFLLSLSATMDINITVLQCLRWPACWLPTCKSNTQEFALRGKNITLLGVSPQSKPQVGWDTVKSAQVGNSNTFGHTFILKAINDATHLRGSSYMTEDCRRSTEFRVTCDLEEVDSLLHARLDPTVRILRKGTGARYSRYSLVRH